MDSLEAIQRDYLAGAEQQLNAFNRLLALQPRLRPVAMSVTVDLVDDVATSVRQA